MLEASMKTQKQKRVPCMGTSLENTWIKQAETYTKHFSQVQRGSSPKGTF